MTRGWMRTILGGASGLGLAVAAYAASTPPVAPATPTDAVHEEVARIRSRIATDPTLEPIRAEERLYRAVRSDVLDPWRSAWLSGQGEGFDALLATPASGPAWTGPRTLERTVDGIRELRWSIAGQPGEAEARSYLAGFASVRDLDLDVHRVEAEDDRATLGVRFDLRGRTPDGALRQDRGELEVTTTRTDAGWRIASVVGRDLESLEAVPGRRPSFEDVTATRGLGDVEVYDRKEAIRRGGYAIAVADYDGDARPDVLVGNYGPVALYRNTEESFVDVTEKVGLRGETLVKSAAFADLDNDGHRDLLLLRFVDDGAGEGDFVAYRNEGDGTFEHKGDVLTRTRSYDRSMPLAVADFDGTACSTSTSASRASGTSRATCSPGKQVLEAQGIWFNDGNWNFREIEKGRASPATRRCTPTRRSSPTSIETASPTSWWSTTAGP